MTQPLDHSQWDRSQKVMEPNVRWDSVLTWGHSQWVGHSRSPDWKPFIAQFNLAFNLMIGHDLGQHRTQPHLGDLPHPTSPWWPPSPSLTLVTPLMTITKNGPFQLALGLTPSHVSAEAGRKHNAALRTVERPRHGLPVKQHGPTTYCLGFPGRPPSWGRWQSRPHTPGCWCTLCQGSSTTSSSNDTFTAQTKHKIILILVWKHLKSCEYTLIIPHRAVQPTTKPH